MGSELGQARGSVIIDYSQPQIAVAALRNIANAIQGDLLKIDAGARKAQAGLNSLTGVLQKLSGAFGISLGLAGLVHVTRMGVELVKTSAEAERTRKSFDVLAAGVGQSSDKMLDAMQRASDGMVSDNELILGANKAMLLGVAKNSEEMGRLLEASRVLGQAMGQDVGKSFNDLVIGLGRLSPLILDNLGIANEGEEMFENYAKSVGKTADSLTKAEKRQILLNKVMEAAQPLLDAETGAADNNANKFDRLGASWHNATQTAGELFGEVGVLGLGLNALAGIIDFVNARWRDSITVLEGVKAAYESVRGALGFGGAAAPAAGGVPKWMTGVSKAASGPLISEQDIADVKIDWSEGISELTERTNEQILDQIETYNRQRANAERDYQTGSDREARDFAINRQRQEEDMLDAITSIHANAARLEKRLAEDLARSIADAQADSSERIAEAREDTTERLIELEEDFAKNRQRAAEDHRDKMLSAAGRLDAIALLEERKRWARENSDAKEAHEEQRDDLQEQLDERIDDENKALAKSIANAKEAHERQLADAREADRLRIEDMQADFIKRKARDDADRAIRLADQAADHAAQLAEMDRAQIERINQINRHAAEERAELDEEALKELAALHNRNEARKKEEEEAEKLWDKYMRHVKESLTNGMAGVGGVLEPGLHTPQGPYIPQYASGGLVRHTGLARVHAGEFVMPRQMMAAASGMGGGRSISVGDIHLSIMGTTNMGESQLRPLVRAVLIEALEEVAGGN